MALMDEFKEERKAVLQNGTTKQKISYIWDYYKWHILIPVIIVIAGISWIVNIITAPDIILNGVMMNIYKMESDFSGEELVNGFYDAHEIDSKEEEINLNMNLYFNSDSANDNYQTLQVLMAWHSADSLDFITSDLPAMTDLTYRGYFSDLREVLNADQLAMYEPYFLYIDQDFFIKRSEKIDEMEDVSDMTYPDPTKPEDMVDPIPVMIDISKSEKIAEAYSTDNNTNAFGITANVQNTETTLNFLDYLME